LNSIRRPRRFPVAAKASRFALLMAGCLAAFSAHGARKRPFYQAGRALAMGDAYTAHDVGFEAVYYNPAGVARPGPPRFKVLDLEFLISSGAFDVFSEAISSIASMPNIIELVSNNVGSNQAVGLSFTPQFLTKNMSLGVLARTYAEAYIDPATTLMDFYGSSDLGAYLQFGVSLQGGAFKLGAGVKAINRAELNRQYEAVDYTAGNLNFATQWKEGIGYGLDLGLLATFPSRLLPTLGISVLNVGNTTMLDRRILFTGSAGAPGAPSAIPQSLNIGFSLNPKHDRGLRSAFSFEVKDLLNVRDTAALGRRFHAGWELNIQDFIFLRTGLNEGRYWTAGVGVSNRAMALEFTSYGENVSFTPESTRRDDRKYAARYSVGF